MANTLKNLAVGSHPLGSSWQLPRKAWVGFIAWYWRNPHPKGEISTDDKKFLSLPSAMHLCMRSQLKKAPWKLNHVSDPVCADWYPLPIVYYGIIIFKYHICTYVYLTHNIRSEIFQEIHKNFHFPQWLQGW